MRFPPHLWRGQLVSGLLGSIAAIGFLIVDTAHAASQITFRVGPLRQTILVDDLEAFAETGELPPALKFYGSVLTPEVRQVLNNRLALDPAISERMIDDVLASPNGALLLDTLAQIAPQVTVEQLQAAIRLAAEQSNSQLNVLSILRAIPQDNLDIDLTAALALVSQLNLSRLEGQSLSRLLTTELAVSETGRLATQSRIAATGIDPTQRGSETVSQRTLVFNDRDRNRLIPLDVYWANTTRSGPLVVLSHGFGADRQFLRYIGEHLASYGFTVVSIEHPGSNVEALSRVSINPEAVEQPSQILPASEFLDRPRDVSYVLDRLAWLNQASPTFRGRLNTEQVVLIGHSLGGYTGLALAGATLDLRQLQTFCASLSPIGLSPADWLQCAAADLPDTTADLSDPRIVQVVAMNPLVGKLFGEKGLTQVRVPTIVLTGTQDGVTPTLAQQLTPFTQLAGPKYLVAVIGGTHLSVGDPENINQSLTQIPFMPELQGEVTVSLRQFLRALALSFVMQQTPEAERYQPFLEPAYAQQFSTSALPLRLTRQLPEGVLSWLRLTGQTSLQPRQSWQVMTSWLQLETFTWQAQVYRRQQELQAYLQLEQVAVTVLQWPLQLLITWVA